MANSAIQKISRRAKQIRKAHPSKAWQACIKQLRANINPGRFPGHVPKRASVERSKRNPLPGSGRRVYGRYRQKVKRATRRATPKSKKTIGAVRSTIREQKGILKERLGDALADQWSATTKREKKNIGKRVSIPEKPDQIVRFSYKQKIKSRWLKNQRGVKKAVGKAAAASAL